MGLFNRIIFALVGTSEKQLKKTLDKYDTKLTDQMFNVKAEADKLQKMIDDYERKYGKSPFKDK